jgi:hypothetical protein
MYDTLHGALAAPWRHGWRGQTIEMLREMLLPSAADTASLPRA